MNIFVNRPNMKNTYKKQNKESEYKAYLKYLALYIKIKSPKKQHMNYIGVNLINKKNEFLKFIIDITNNS